ncbi:MAG: aminopeptidase P family protein [Ramlibacter sp.]|nr:aminopeptidase P family protein [Ramlibacter sp.]
MFIRPHIGALQRLISELDLDAIVCMSPENFTYVAGAYITTLKTIRPRQAFVVIPRRGDPVSVVCGIEESLVRAEGWIRDVRGYTEFVHEPVDVLAQVLEEKGLATGLIGFDLAYLPVTSHERLTGQLPRLRMVDTTEGVAAIRAIKTEAEVQYIELATRQTHHAIVETLAQSQLGDTDQVIANRIIKKMFDAGAQGVQHLHLASGERTPLVHNAPSDDPTQVSQILRLDVGGTYGPYASDVARTYSTGQPSRLHQDVYRALCQVQAKTIGQMKPGVPAEDLYFGCRAAFEAFGLPCTLPHIGHSFGIEAHESPMIRPGDKTRLKPGMVINIEPMTRDSDGNLYHTEDLVLVTDEGYRLLTYGLAPAEIPEMGRPLALA